MDRGVWWATVHRVAKNQTQLKWLNTHTTHIKSLNTVVTYSDYRNLIQGEMWINGQERKKVKSLSCVWLFATPWTVTYQAPPSMGFSRQEYCSGFAFPSPGDLPNPGNPGLPHYKQTLDRLSHQGNYVVNRHDFEQTSGDSKGQGSLACCNA